jgi:hypothetical protein
LFSIDPEIVDLLDAYQVLPSDVSMATIKLILFLDGNVGIQP